MARGQQLTLDLIDNTVELADTHLKEASPAKEEAQANSAAAGKSAAAASSTKQPKPKSKTAAWREKKSNKHIKELEAKLAAQDNWGGSNSLKHKSGGAARRPWWSC